jgi:hypothetical protein
LNTRIRSRYLNRIVFLTLLLTAPIVGGAADRARVNEIGDAFMCICGCGQVLPKCNHLNCPSSGPMMQELAAHIDAGESKEEII